MGASTVGEYVSTKEIGDDYEDKILAECYAFDDGYKKTKKSGATHGDGDIVSPRTPGTPQIAIDAKFRGNAKSAIITDADLKKIVTQAAIRRRTGIIVTNSKEHEMIAVLPLRLLLNLIHKKEK